MGANGSQTPAYSPCRVLVNKLADTPHRQGQVVLRTIAQRREMTICFDRGKYLVHVASGQGRARCTVLVDECDSVEQARGAALELLQVERSV